MPEYYYTRNGHKVRLVRWSGLHQKFVVEISKGTEQLIATELLTKTDELVTEVDEPKIKY